jgi:hypothetical protein
MARRAFFSFHYQRDITRAMLVKNSWVTQEREAAGFFDGSLEERAKREGDEAVRRLINRGLENTSVTVVLIGAETATRRWVSYEIAQSYDRGNGMLGVYIHSIPNFQRMKDLRGSNPFANVTIRGTGASLDRMYPILDWTNDDGYSNLGAWIERAARNAGR